MILAAALRTLYYNNTDHEGIEIFKTYQEKFRKILVAMYNDLLDDGNGMTLYEMNCFGPISTLRYKEGQ